MNVTPSMLPHLAECRGWRSSSESSPAADRGWDLDDLLSEFAEGGNPEIPDEYVPQVDFGREILAQLPGKKHTQRSVLCFEDSFLCGTADLVVEDDQVIVLDWKSGWGDRPPAQRNLQLLSYACGIMRDFNRDSVEAWIVELDKRTVTKTTVTQAGAKDIEAVVNALIRESMEAQPEQWQACSSCKYCARKETCPALSKKTEEITAIVPVNTELLTAEQAGEWLTRWGETIEQVEALYSHIRGKVTQIIAAGGSVPGWTCKPGRKNRKWKQGAALPPDAYESVPLSIAQYEKKVGKKNIPADLIEETWGNPQLVKEKQNA